MKINSALLFIIPALITTAACSNQNAASAPDSTETINDNQNTPEEVKQTIMNIQIGDHLFTATLVENSTTEALKKLLSAGPLTIEMRDYGSMEKVGSIGTNLPRNDEPTVTEAGDLIVYQGSAFVIYYESNSWNFTKIGKINNVTKDELKKILGSGDVTVILSLKNE